MTNDALNAAFFFLVTTGVLANARPAFEVKDKLRFEVKDQLRLPQPLPGLDYTFYDETCPQAEGIVRSRVKYFVKKNVYNAAKLLRLFYQDCFVKGCDASVLLQGSAYGPWDEFATLDKALSVEAFEIVDDIKAHLEMECPQTVSCADIVVLAARDSVLAAEGPYFPIPTGRRDTREIDTLEETEVSMPKPSWRVTELLRSFKTRGLDVMDLVALSGAHTIGHAHCGSVANRLCPVDLRMKKKTAKKLLKACPNPNSTSTIELDSKSPDEFDKKYYKNLVKNKGMLTSDQDLYYDARTSEIVRSFKESEDLFFMQFSLSAAKMSLIGVLRGMQGEIRVNCSTPNYTPPPSSTPPAAPVVPSPPPAVYPSPPHPPPVWPPPLTPAISPSPSVFPEITPSLSPSSELSPPSSVLPETSPSPSPSPESPSPSPSSEISSSPSVSPENTPVPSPSSESSPFTSPSAARKSSSSEFERDPVIVDEGQRIVLPNQGWQEQRFPF